MNTHNEPKPNGTSLTRSLGATLIERVANALAIGVAVVPYVGGPPSVAISQWVQKRQDDRWIAYWQTIEVEVSRLGVEKVDAGYLQSEEFARRIQQLWHEVAQNADEGKLRFLRDFLISSLWQRGSDVHWRDLYWEHVRRLSGSHLALLEHFFRKQGHLSYKQRFELPQPSSDAPIRLAQFGDVFDQFAPELLGVLLADLSSSGLVQPWGRNPQEDGWSISDSGIALMAFLSAEWRLQAPTSQA